MAQPRNRYEITFHVMLPKKLNLSETVETSLVSVCVPSGSLPANYNNSSLEVM